VKQAQFTIGVFGIILNSAGNILLCHRTDIDFWNLPGGGVDTHETPWNAVLREIKEETGLEAKVNRLLGVYSKPDVNDLVFLFLCEPIGGKLTLSEESDQLEYFSIDKLPTNLIPNHLERIQDFIQASELILKEQTK